MLVADAALLLVVAVPFLRNSNKSAVNCSQNLVSFHIVLLGACAISIPDLGRICFRKRNVGSCN
jgi:hypothetical protein